MHPRSVYEPRPKRKLSAVACVELADALEIHDALIFDLYPGLPHVQPFSLHMHACTFIHAYMHTQQSGREAGRQ